MKRIIQIPYYNEVRFEGTGVTYGSIGRRVVKGKYSSGYGIIG